MRAGYGWASQIPRLSGIAPRDYRGGAGQAPPRVEQPTAPGSGKVRDVPATAIPR